jgi:transcriptional regulator
MYIPQQFRNEDTEEIFKYIEKYPFGELITSDANGPLVSHIPFTVEEKNNSKFLKGHLARGNNQWRTFNSSKVLAVFTGPHAYISSSWYNHLNVPTWNYIAIHAYGTIRILSDDELYRSLEELMQKFEYSLPGHITLEKMGEYATQQMKGIVGFEITITELQGKWKLSQNRNKEDFNNVINELQKLDENSKRIADEMSSLKNKL